MWVFYVISLPLTMGMVLLTLMYFAGPDVPRYVLFIVGYTWFCSISVIILVPADMWAAIIGHDKGVISFFWSLSYWSTFLLTWAVVPIIQGYEDAGDFTVTERLKTSVHANLVFHLCVGSIALCGLILLIILRTNWGGGILGFAMACSNTFGLVTGAFLLGFGLSEIPKGLWQSADWITRQKVLSHKVAKMAVKLDDAHQEFSNAIVVAQATSKQMSRRDPLRPYMNIIDKMLLKMLNEDPTFKPQGGKLGENDMDYDTNEKTMAQLRRQLKRARERYYRYKSVVINVWKDVLPDINDETWLISCVYSNRKVFHRSLFGYVIEYMNFVTDALELEDTIKNYEHRNSTGWLALYPGLFFFHWVNIFFCSTVVITCPWLKYISSFRTERAGTLGSFFDMIELVWRCILSKLFEKLFSIILGCMSAAILLAEATILPSGVDLSLFSILINTVDRHEVLVQVTAFIPLVYMCVCTYYSLFKFGMLTFYSFTPRQTNSVSLLMICSQVARYAAPISYNFLNLIRLPRDAKDSTTIFEKRMGNIDDAVPFFGKGFNKIYPLIMVIYTIMITSNFFGRIVSYFGNWKIFSHQNEEVEDLDGFDPSGLIILNKERSWLEQGHKVGELVIPLARNFNNANTDLESASNSTVSAEAKANASLIEDGKSSYSKSHTADSQHHTGKGNTGRKYTAIRTQPTPEETSLNSSQNTTFTEASHDAGDTRDTTMLPQSGVAATWQLMKMGFQNFKANIGAKKFLPLRESQENTKHSQVPSSESLDEIFEKLKRPAPDHRKYSSDDDLDLDDYAMDIKKPYPSR